MCVSHSQLRTRSKQQLSRSKKVITYPTSMPWPTRKGCHQDAPRFWFCYHNRSVPLHLRMECLRCCKAPRWWSFIKPDCVDSEAVWWTAWNKMAMGKLDLCCLPKVIVMGNWDVFDLTCFFSCCLLIPFSFASPALMGWYPIDCWFSFEVSPCVLWTTRHFTWLISLSFSKV